MKKLCVVALVLSSCASGNTVQESARQAFEDWRLALLEGDAEKTYRMMSEGLKAQWLFDLFKAEDLWANEWRRTLPGEVVDLDGVKRSPRTYLDLWLEHQRATRPPRAAPLHPLVSTHPSLLELYRRYFTQELATVRQKFSSIRVADVYADQTGVSVTVKSPEGRTELIVLISESTGWKIDGIRGAIQHLPRQQ